MTSYSDSGVNIELGDDASKVMYQAARLTWENRKGRIGEILAPKDDFSGVRGIKMGGLPEGTFLSLGFDGVGTKVEVAERMGRHETMAFDLFAMVCDDAVCYGGEPIVVGSILDVHSLGKDGASFLPFMKQMAEGYIAAAKAARVAVINGEIAELGARVNGYGDFNYNWGAAAMWIAKEDRILNGGKIAVGDKIITLREKGFRSNGLSLVRKVLTDRYGAEWHKEMLDGQSLGDWTLIPSQIYCAAVSDLFGGFEGTPICDVHGVSHITGGGLPGKLGRLLKRAQKGARLTQLFSPSPLMTHVMEVGGVTLEEAYRTWNMGNGMLVIVPPQDEEKALAALKERGLEAQTCGEIIPELKIELPVAEFGVA